MTTLTDTLSQLRAALLADPDDSGCRGAYWDCIQEHQDESDLCKATVELWTLCQRPNWSAMRSWLGTPARKLCRRRVWDISGDTQNWPRLLPTLWGKMELLDMWRRVVNRVEVQVRNREEVRLGRSAYMTTNWHRCTLTFVAGFVTHAEFNCPESAERLLPLVLADQPMCEAGITNGVFSDGQAWWPSSKVRSMLGITGPHLNDYADDQPARTALSRALRAWVMPEV